MDLNLQPSRSICHEVSRIAEGNAERKTLIAKWLP